MKKAHQALAVVVAASLTILICGLLIGWLAYASRPAPPLVCQGLVGGTEEYTILCQTVTPEKTRRPE